MSQSPENVPSVLTDEDINRAYVKSGVAADLEFWAKYKFPLARAIEQAVLAKYAAPATVGQHVQEGWKLVPIEPMHEMVSAMSTSQARDDEGEFPMLTDLIDFSGENKTHTAIRAAYAAMLAASPTPPAGEGQEPVCVDCGDQITPHDPGVCGCCYSTKYEIVNAAIAAMGKGAA